MWSQMPPEVASRLQQPLERSWNGTLSSGKGWEQFIAELEEFRQLADDYDGQGAIAPTADTVDSAVSLARLLEHLGMLPPTYVVASVNGSANLEWQLADDVSIGFEVVDPDQADVYLHLPGQQGKHWVLTQAVVA
jgi:membrane-bound lytic murein transglycosylase B